MTKVWTCDVCGFGGVWRDGHSQIYGSMLTEEEGIPQFYTCSEACRLKVKMPEDWRIKVEATGSLSQRQLGIFKKTLRSGEE